MSKEIARLLTDFSHEKSAKLVTSPFAFAKTVRIHSPASPVRDVEVRTARDPVVDEARPAPAPAPDLTILIRAAVDKARAEEQAAARQELERALAEERRASAETVAQERARWAAEQADILSARLSEAFRQVEERLAGQIANVLKPFIAHAFRRQALAEAEMVLNSLLAGAVDPVIRVSGPDDLLDAIRSRLADDAPPVAFKASGATDVVMVAQDTTVETRIGAWQKRLESLSEAD